MSDLEHHQIRTNGINLHVATQGEGPLVIMCHGFPGLWYSWRHQLPALAAAGYRGVAVDMRGYGQSDRPTQPRDYHSETMIADMLGLLDALGETEAVFVGHDFGAPLVWNLAVRRPEQVKGVVSVSVPYAMEFSGMEAGDLPPETRDGPKPTEIYAMMAQEHFLHLHYFQTIGPAEAELGAQPREFLKRLFWALSGKGDLMGAWASKPSEGTGYLDVLPEPDKPLPWPWLTEEDLDYWVSQYVCGDPMLTFIGGLSSYRAADLNWATDGKYSGAKVERPAAYITGSNDTVLKMAGPDAITRMRSFVPDLRVVEIIPEAGHFVQQESPEATNAALLQFLETLN